MTPFTSFRIATLVLAAVPLLSACGGKAPCAICYEDEWSRDPFPGQPKQHIRTPTPDDIKNGLPHGAREFLGETSHENPY